MSAVRIGSAISISVGPEFSEIIEPVQGYMFSCNPENKMFADLESNSCCVDLLDSFAGTALQSGYDVWSYVDFHDKENFLKVLMSGFWGINSAVQLDDGNFVFDAPETLWLQNSVPNQPPSTDAAEVRSLLL